MRSRKPAALALLPALLAFPTLAAAADMGFPPILESPEIVPDPVEIGSNWYLRGDMGIDFSRPRVSYGPAPAVDLNTGDSHQDWFGGLGAGYRFGKRVRADVTVDWRRMNFRGGTGDDDMHPAVASSMNLWTGLANLYIDLGPWRSFSPYVGAGLGMAYADLRTPFVSPSQTAMHGGDATHFAAAAMAGVAFSVSDNTKVDLGYRYLWLDNVKAGLDGVGHSIDYRNLGTHELRLGFRYMID